MQNCRKEREERKKLVPQNKFEILASRVMSYGVELGRQEVEEKKE